MISKRPAEQRGKTSLDWLDSKHSFSFGDYYDEKYMNFGPLRVINEDIVSPGAGFGLHPHRDMEIITYVLDGALEHRDSLGTGTVINRGDVQRMSAGTGVVHSEFNHSKTDPVHFMQIWIMPERRSIPAEYEQKKLELKMNEWSAVANRDGECGALKIHRDLELSAASIQAGEKLNYVVKNGAAWVQVLRGSLSVANSSVAAGDGLAIVNEEIVELIAITDSEVLLFDLFV